RVGADRARSVLDDADRHGGAAPRVTRRSSAVQRLARAATTARRGRPQPSHALRRYRQYYEFARPGPTSLRTRSAALAYFEFHPVVSIIVAGDDTELAATLASIAAQLYDRIEVLWCAPHPHTTSGATELEVRHVAVDGTMAERHNAGVDGALGELCLCVRAGDRLERHCVFELVAALQGGADAAYGDEDRLDERGEHTAPHLKPAVFGPETQLSYDVCGAPLCVRTALLQEVRFSASAAPVESHDLSLRLFEAGCRFEHVAGVLLNRPQHLDPDPADAAAASVRVVRGAFVRRGLTASVEVGEFLPSVRYEVDPPSPPPSVAIVIPTRDRLDLLKACVESVTRSSTYPNYSIVICDNDSKEEATLRWLKDCGHQVVATPGPFNYARIVNKGVQATNADFVVTLNNDTTIATERWLERLVGLCSMPQVGSVGVKLVYPSGRIQHEGVAIIPMPVHLSRDVNYAEPDRWLTSTRDAVAVTGACSIVRSACWELLGGLDESLAVAFNDVDFCLRLWRAGWRVVYTPEVVLGHHESASRGDLHPLEDEALLIARYDLFGDFVDPTVSPMVRQYTTRAELDVPAPGR
ncbi:MAG TPA: glycosyltransferase family 2 protein, partial [Acidimicrobiales bacterium]|nr:glycosyltransferase family 2 protein [Acidimicrobiales bacterium]